ncbi:MAG TPA: HXXEE domain-containing protein, partial [Solirubrobacteraceae bacterium]|nr:HXXEE domain-containing protein [Solirubrobacteraceae bacterium]
MSVVDRYRTNWPRVGGVIAMGSAGALALTHRRMSTPQLLSALNLLALPLAFPKKRWLGIAPVLFGFGQAVGHGLIFNRLAKDRYSPGFLASLLLHVPIGIQYLRALRDEGPIESADLRKAGPYTIAFA